jgi:hypothetical protein
LAAGAAGAGDGTAVSGMGVVVVTMGWAPEFRCRSAAEGESDAACSTLTDLMKSSSSPGSLAAGGLGTKRGVAAAGGGA